MTLPEILKQTSFGAGSPNKLIQFAQIGCGRELKWDAKKEMFRGDKEANAMISRKSRKPEYDIALLMKKAGLK